MAEGAKEQELDGTSVLSRSLVSDDGQDDVLRTNMSVLMLPPVSGSVDTNALPAMLAEELGHTLKDGGHQSPRMAQELPLVSKSSVIAQSLESLESNGVVLGATGALSLASGTQNKDGEGFTLDVESSPLLTVVEEEMRVMMAHKAYLDGDFTEDNETNVRLWKRFEATEAANKKKFMIEEAKARIAVLGDKYPLTQRATEERIKRRDELHLRISKLGEYDSAPGLSPHRDYARNPSSVDLGSTSAFCLNLDHRAPESPRNRDHYRALSSGDPWETHITTMQDRYREAARQGRDERIPRSKLVEYSLHPGESAGGVNYREMGIGYEYDTGNNFFESEYLQMLSRNSSVESIKYASSPSGSIHSMHEGNDIELPQPLASVLDDIEKGHWDENNPPNISPSKEEVEAYLANIPGMKMFSPRAPKEPPHRSVERPTNANPTFTARAITDSRMKSKLEKSLLAAEKHVDPEEKRRIKKKVKKEIIEREKAELMQKAINEAAAFIKSLE
jgi:hypothetical protein